MEILKTILIVLEVIASVVLVAVVTMQSGKESGLGALTGNNDSYLSKSKFGSLDKLLASATKWIALAWIVLTLSLSLI
jgi:preprotein translocase subunit SecG